jgi:Flp pilus assembly protein TadD
LLRERGDEKSTTRGLAGLGIALLNLGDRAAAREMIEDSLAVARRFDNRWSTAMSLTELGHVELADGDHTRAQALLTEAASLFADTGNLIYHPCTRPPTRERWPPFAPA